MKRLQTLIAIVSVTAVAGTGIVPAGVLSTVVYAADIVTVNSFEELQEATPADLETAASYVVDLSSGQAEGSNGETLTTEEAFGIDGADSAGDITAQIEETEAYAVSEADADKAIVFSPYARHRLTVYADTEITETFGATESAYYTKDGGYRLCYDSDLATKEAYDALTEVYGEDAVLIDLPIQLSTEDSSEQAAYGWGTAYMHLDVASRNAEADWSGEDVTVAVLDTGINTGHAVFADKTIEKANDASIEDDNGHGTAVAGIIAESTPDFVNLMPVKIANANGECSFDDMLNGLTEAAEAGADIVNLSMNVTLSDYVKSGVLTQAQANAYISRADAVCLSAEENGVVICVSAGNEGKDIQDTCDFPASLEHVLSTGAIGENEERSDFSSYGEELDFAAPGQNVQCAWIGTSSSVKALSGTSMASPYLAAACAVIKSEDPDADRMEIESELASIAKDLGEEGRDTDYGYGVPVFPYETEESNPSVDTTDQAELIDGISFPEDWDPEDPQNEIAYLRLNGEALEETEEPVLTTSSITAKTKWKLYDDNTYKEFWHDSRNTAGSGIIPVIDVSYHNDSVNSSSDDINWSKVKAAGVKGVMIRCGYRASATGTLNMDKQFYDFLKDAKAAGLKVGVYFFSQAISEGEANAEAVYAINAVNSSGIQLDLPMAIDIEYASANSGRLYNAHLSKSTQTKIAKAFCDRVKKDGYTPLVYASSAFLVSNLDGNALYADGYPVWMARYRYAAYSDSDIFYAKPVSIWQCTSDAAVNGISTRVDLNYWYNYYGWVKVTSGNTVKWRWKDVDGNIVKNKWISYLTDWYFIKSDTYMAANEWVKDSTGWCWLESNGVMARSKWVKYAKDGEWYYLDEDGHMLTNGWAKDSTGWCWLGADGKIDKSTGWVKLGGHWYYLNENHYRLENAWMEDTNGLCWLSEDGTIAIDAWIKYNGEWYYLNTSGYRASNVWAKDSVGWCRLDESGKIIKTTGWILIEDEWYYLKSNHYRAENQWVKDNTGKCWLGSDGKVTKDQWCNDGDNWYYLGSDGYPLTDTWKNDETGWRYLSEEGNALKTKWLKYNGEWYYLNADAYRAENTWVKDGTGWCYMDADGKITKASGWIELGGIKYYLNESHYRVENTWVEDIKGLRWLNNDGMITRGDWIKDSGVWYYLNADGYKAVNTWAKDTTGWCWLGADGKITKSTWIKYNGSWYYLKANGYMAANEWAKDSIGWCYMDANGKITKSTWIKYNGSWYYLKANGYMAANEWATDSKYRYWMGSDGKISKTYSK